MTWYVINNHRCEPKVVTEQPAWERKYDADDPQLRTYTISEDPTKEGWESDCGCSSYGLTYEKARYICDVLNAHESKP